MAVPVYLWKCPRSVGRFAFQLKRPVWFVNVAVDPVGHGPVEKVVVVWYASTVLIVHGAFCHEIDESLMRPSPSVDGLEAVLRKIEPESMNDNRIKARIRWEGGRIVGCEAALRTLLVVTHEVGTLSLERFPTKAKGKVRRVPELVVVQNVLGRR